ncbi:MAG: hypothetical protein ACO1O1_03545 [Adhaeribacter sp.]
MGKGKKKNKKLQNASFYKAIKPLIKDNRVLLAMLGSMGVGVALASAVGSDRGRAIVDNISRALKNSGLAQDLLAAAPEEKKGRQTKHPAGE